MIESQTIVPVYSDVVKESIRSEIVFDFEGEIFFRITEDDFVRELEDGDLRILE